MHDFQVHIIDALLFQFFHIHRRFSLRIKSLKYKAKKMIESKYIENLKIGNMK